MCFVKGSPSNVYQSHDIDLAPSLLLGQLPEEDIGPNHEAVEQEEAICHHKDMPVNPTGLSEGNAESNQQPGTVDNHGQDQQGDITGLSTSLLGKSLHPLLPTLSVT